MITLDIDSPISKTFDRDIIFVNANINSSEGNKFIENSSINNSFTWSTSDFAPHLQRFKYQHCYNWAVTGNVACINRINRRARGSIEFHIQGNSDKSKSAKGRSWN